NTSATSAFPATPRHSQFRIRIEAAIALVATCPAATLKMADTPSLPTTALSGGGQFLKTSLKKLILQPGESRRRKFKSETMAFRTSTSAPNSGRGNLSFADISC